MTKPELIERAKRQLNAPELEVNLAACVMQASGRLAQKVMRDGALRGLLQQEYSVTLNAAGEGDLLAAMGSVTSAAGEILLEGVKYGVVLDAEGQRLVPLLHYHDFLAPQMTAFGYYTIKDRTTILTRARNQAVESAFDIVSATGPLTITASYTPADVEDFPPELEDMLVETLCDIARPTNANASTA